MSIALTRSLRSHQQDLAEKIVDLQYLRQLRTRYPDRQRNLHQAGEHLLYLTEAVEAEDPLLFSEYLTWIKSIFAALNIPAQDLLATLSCIRQVLVDNLPAHEVGPALYILDGSLDQLGQTATDIHTFLDGDGPLDKLARRFLDRLLAADRRTASQMILDAVQSGVSIPDIYLRVFQRTQWELGRLWQINRISVGQEHFCTAATQQIMSQLYPYIFTGERKLHRIVVACVGGELHEIGARMVADFFEMKGWDTYFLGANTPTESILRIVEERRANVLALSVTMSSHLDTLKRMIQDLRAASSMPPRILVGGYSFNRSPDLWRTIGADGYAPDAENAVTEANRVLAL